MIKQIQIDRFKSIRHTPLLKLGRVNLLTGANGKGKSSFCQALLVLSQTWRRGLTDNLLATGEWKRLGTYDDIHYVYDSDETIVFKIVTSNEKENDFLLTYKKSENRPTLGEIVSAEVDGKPISDEAGSDEETVGRMDEQAGQQEVRLTKLNDYPFLMSLCRMYYIAAERKAAPYREDLDETDRPDYLAPDGSNILNFLWRHQGCVERVEALLKEIFGGGMLQLQTQNNELVLTMNAVSNSKLFQPVNVGFGYSYIISLLAAVVMAGAGDMLIVENPEAHLHPSAQARMMAVLIREAEKKDIQLMVETHSDHILNTTLVAAKNKEGLKTGEDIQILFFNSGETEDGHAESVVQNLTITDEGHIVPPPPKDFFEQYATDLRTLYL